MNLRACHRCASVTLSSSGLCGRCWQRRVFTPAPDDTWASVVCRVVGFSLLVLLALSVVKEAQREPLPSPGFQASWPAAARPGAIVVAAKPPRPSTK
jgi:hypothetical protein